MKFFTTKIIQLFFFLLLVFGLNHSGLAQNEKAVVVEINRNSFQSDIEGQRIFEAFVTGVEDSGLQK
jgi:hypothetical protein